MERRHKHGIIFAVSMLVIGGGISLFIVSRPQTVVSPTPDTRPNTNQVKTAPLIMLELPGTAPIRALSQNYNDPSSQWVVVSKDHALSQLEYIPSDLELVPVASNTTKTNEERSLRTTILPAVESLFADAKKAGFDLFIASGYRSYALQKSYFENYAKQSGEAAANQYSARPGQSEHQTGLAFDISLASRECYLETCFGETAAGTWLATHAPEYGFILRYPANKTDITKYQYEPWHFRYVGIELAQALTKAHLTLDEAYPPMQKALGELQKQSIVQ